MTVRVVATQVAKLFHSRDAAAANVHPKVHAATTNNPSHDHVLSNHNNVKTT